MLFSKLQLHSFKNCLHSVCTFYLIHDCMHSIKWEVTTSQMSTGLLSSSRRSVLIWQRSCFAESLFLAKPYTSIRCSYSIERANDLWIGVEDLWGADKPYRPAICTLEASQHSKRNPLKNDGVSVHDVFLWLTLVYSLKHTSASCCLTKLEGTKSQNIDAGTKKQTEQWLEVSFTLSSD